MKFERTFTVGTRAYGKVAPGDYRVVCATCGAGGTVAHRTLQSAGAAATRDSGKPCHKCGAR